MKECSSMFVLYFSIDWKNSRIHVWQDNDRMVKGRHCSKLGLLPSTEAGTTGSQDPHTLSDAWSKCHESSLLLAKFSAALL